MERYEFLQGSEMLILTGDRKVYTILGSCVSVVLWDKENCIGGINHYLLPEWDGKVMPSPKFGDYSIETMYKSMIEVGARKYSLTAEIYGGSNMISLFKVGFRIGNKNIAIAKEIVSKLNIPIITENCGGELGRKIYFNNLTGQVRCEFINQPKQY